MEEKVCFGLCFHTDKSQLWQDNGIRKAWLQGQRPESLHPQLETQRRERHGCSYCSIHLFLLRYPPLALCAFREYLCIYTYRHTEWPPLPCAMLSSWNKTCQTAFHLGISIGFFSPPHPTPPHPTPPP